MCKTVGTLVVGGGVREAHNVGVAKSSESDARGMQLLQALVQPRPLPQHVMENGVTLPLFKEMEENLRLPEREGRR